MPESWSAYAEVKAYTHPAVDAAVGALHNYLGAMREQRRRHRELEDAKAAIPSSRWTWQPAVSTPHLARSTLLG